MSAVPNFDDAVPPPDTYGYDDERSAGSNGQADELDRTDEAEAGPVVLPAAWWNARPAHTHVLEAARARGAAPDAVLGATLAHIALRTPHTLTLPPLVGSRGSLNFAVGVIGTSGAGKGAAFRTGEALVPELGDWLGIGPLGTGPGMLDCWFRRRKDADAQRARDGWLYVADEGQLLAKLAEQQASTTVETLRSAWSGERVGTQTVGAPWRVLAAGTYRMCWLLGLQPAIARPLLADTDGGTPQRFAWFGQIDPDAPLDRPAWPGPLDWTPPAKTTTPRDVDVDAEVAAGIVRRRHEVLTGRRTPGVYDSHRDYLTLKAAALLGILDGRTSVTPADWSLALELLVVSDRVREQTIAAHRAAEAREEAGRNARAAARARAEESARRGVTDAVTRVARVIHRAVGRHGEASMRDMRRSVASRDAEWADDAIGHALACGWIEEVTDGRYVATNDE